MSTELTMPKLSDTMEEGTILRWLKHEGERIEKGEVVAEVETDKADMELEANASGTLAEIRVKEGESAAVGAVLAVLGTADGAGETSRSAAEKVEHAPEPGASGAADAAPKVVRESKPAPPPPRASKAPSPPPVREPEPTPPSAPPKTKWTPHAGAESPPRPSGREEQSKLRLAVAKQMVASMREVPHFYVTSEVDMSEVARLRAALTDAVPERITYTHFIIRALALTLPRHPRVNASWTEGAVTYHDEVNIGVAVAIDDGLIAPVLRDCQHLSLRAIARMTSDLVEKAQAGRVSGEGLTGATFSVSNMGMLDIEQFTAVIIPPQAAILAVGAIKERPVVRDGQLAVAKTMRITLSVDHRVLNGIEAGRFLEDLKHTLGRPALLLLGEE